MLVIGRYQMVTIWMGGCLRTGKLGLFRYVTSRLGQLSLSSLRGR